MRGTFITFEGSEGSGKSTQIRLLGQYLKKRNKKILILREPGGVQISEKIRRILLDVKNKKMSSECETLLYLAARAQIVDEIIAPALKEGRIILCDRFMDSTIAYQGFGNKGDIAFIEKVGFKATKGIVPHITFLFDIDAQKGLRRIRRAKDRIERRALSFHERVRKGYLHVARKYPRRVKLIKSDQTKSEIQTIIRKHINRIIK